MEDDFFADDDDEASGARAAEPEMAPWFVLIIDDEPDIHQVTRLALMGIRFQGRPIQLINAHSGAEAIDILTQRQDIALALVDVVMETDDAGLKCIRTIREDLKNRMIRLVLRTGQPGQVPEREVIEKYDINDYKAKTELTRDKLFTTVIGNLRSYNDLLAIELSRRVIDQNRQGLLKIVDASASLFRVQSIERFAEGALAQLQALLFIDKPAVLARGSLAALSARSSLAVVAAVGSHRDLAGKTLSQVTDPALNAIIDQALRDQASVSSDTHFVGFVRHGQLQARFSLLIVEGAINLSEADRSLIELFCNNVGIAYENLLLHERLADRTNDLVDSQAKLSRLIQLGIAMSAEKDGAKLMEMLLLGAKDLANADGGTLYIRTEDDYLAFQILRNDTMGVAMGGTTGHPVDFPPVPLYDPDGQPNHRNVVAHAVHTETMVCIDDAYATTEFDFSGTRAFDGRAGYRSTSFLTVPLKPRGGAVIGALQLINARSVNARGGDPGQVGPFSSDIRSFVEALAAQAATAMYNRSLLDDQDRLTDAMVHILADAIDAKSPYTGGHCQRVPELAVMLAEAACASTDGALAGFNFANEGEWREFRLGALLHDCGKVTTPEYVVDKATKLETINNRIHEIRARFEILLRDAEIAMLRRIADGADPAECQRDYDARFAELTEDFTFIAECNLGGEFLDADKVSRLNHLAETTWVRHFSNRLGLAHDELRRHGTAPERPLPIVEHLLADRPEHLVPRNPHDRALNSAYGFKVTVPGYEFNFGELYNLTISRGTLTAEERYKVNEHIIQTIVMLEHLPLPKGLRRIPEYAGTHHETLIGNGYPRRLTKDQLSIPSRIMAIADIFEALTASDRPYKRAKTLSEAIQLMDRFRADQHIDADLFRLFLREGVYKRYAERFLTLEQIDEVDISVYLAEA